jgi:hypothetical protein
MPRPTPCRVRETACARMLCETACEDFRAWAQVGGPGGEDLGIARGCAGSACSFERGKDCGCPQRMSHAFGPSTAHRGATTCTAPLRVRECGRTTSGLPPDEGHPPSRRPAACEERAPGDVDVRPSAAALVSHGRSDVWKR